MISRSAEETGEKGHEDEADKRYAASRHELLHTLRLSARVVVAVALEQVYDTPNCEACAKRDHESLKDVYRGVEKFHKVEILPESYILINEGEPPHRMIRTDSA